MKQLVNSKYLNRASNSSNYWYFTKSLQDCGCRSLYKDKESVLNIQKTILMCKYLFHAISNFVCFNRLNSAVNVLFCLILNFVFSFSFVGLYSDKVALVCSLISNDLVYCFLMIIVMNFKA